MPSHTSKPKLSRGVLDMKFMQRTKAKVSKEADDEQSRALYFNEINEKMLKCNSNFIIEQSYSICEGLIDGRLSFGGMNPEVERLMEEEKAEKLGKHQMPEQPKEVSDQEMANSYYANMDSGASKSMQRKLMTKSDYKKRQHNISRGPSRNGVVKRNRPLFKRPRRNDGDN